VSGVVDFAEHGTVVFERVSDQSGNREHEVPVGHRGTDHVGDEGAALMAGGAEAALFAGEGEEECVTTIEAIPSGESGVEVTASEEGRNRGGCFRVKDRQLVRVIVKHLPDR